MSNKIYSTCMHKHTSMSMLTHTHKQRLHSDFIKLWLNTQCHKHTRKHQCTYTHCDIQLSVSPLFYSSSCRFLSLPLWSVLSHRSASANMNIAKYCHLLHTNQTHMVWWVNIQQPRVLNVRLAAMCVLWLFCCFTSKTKSFSESQWLSRSGFQRIWEILTS